MYDQQFFDWIDSHHNEDPQALRLKYAGKTSDFDYAAAITQIECRRRFAGKLRGTLASFTHFFFPSLLAGEQSTGDMLAHYHADLSAEALTAVDLTAGLGIDCFALAAKGLKVTAVELDSRRAEALKYNADGMGMHIDVECDDCRNFIERQLAAGHHYDLAFIDPARRAGDGSRIYALADCRPDVLAMMPLLERFCTRLIIKASPMLDVAHTIASLPVRPQRLICLGSTSECKEIVAVIDFENETTETIISAVSIHNKGTASIYNFLRSEEAAQAMPAPGAPVKAGDYIYEPYPSLMKAGVFKLLARDYDLNIFTANTRLFYSETPKEFEGERYKVMAVYPYASRIIKRFKKEYGKINVAVRNFGMTADALRRKLGVDDGGSLRVYGLTDNSGERLLVVVAKA